jgi:hypothetical protein
LIKKNWIRLDFNQDGHVSVDDIKHGAKEIFEFLKIFEYLQVQPPSTAICIRKLSRI